MTKENSFKKAIGAVENKGKAAGFGAAKCQLADRLIKAGIDKAVFSAQEQKTAA